jgi:hypothetical protein
VAGGTAIYYLLTPRPVIQAVDWQEIIEGTMERSAAVATWPITADAATNYSFNYFPAIPVIGIAPRRQMLSQSLTQIENICSNFVRSYDNNSATYWTGTGLWAECSIADGTFPNWTIAVTGGVPVYGTADSLSFGVQTAVLWEAYRVLSKLTKTARAPNAIPIQWQQAASNAPSVWEKYESAFTNDPSWPNFPTQFNWIYSLASDADLLDALKFDAPDYRPLLTNYTPSYFEMDGYSPFTEHYEITDGYIFDNRAATAIKQFAPERWDAQFGAPGFVGWAKIVSNNVGLLCADLGAGVTGVISMIIGTTGVVYYSESGSIVSNVIGEPVSSFVWTNTFNGTLTGTVYNSSEYNPISLFDYLEYSDVISEGIVSLTASNAPDETFASASYSVLTYLLAKLRYTYPRPAVIEWSFKYCRE